MTEKIFRFECNGKGIYEAVEKDCSENDKRKLKKPDSSWLSKVGKDYPGAISFWTELGLKKYINSGLRDWHSSVVEGKTKYIIAKKPNNLLYEDKYQVISNKDNIKVIREMVFNYLGPKEPSPRNSENRPSFIRHHESIRDWNAYAYYSGSDETFLSGASVGVGLGLQRIGIHHDILPPGHRSSLPHAHKIEEELLVVLEGNPDIWINGHLYRAGPKDVIFFRPGTGLSHTIINNTSSHVKMMIFGEQDESNNDLIYYPKHPMRNEECKRQGCYWEDVPKIQYGKNNGVPGDESSRKYSLFEFQKSYTSFEQKKCGDEKSKGKVYYKDRDLARGLNAQRVSLHHVVLSPGYRSSYPHAESEEEEFIFLLKGCPTLWLNGRYIDLKEGDCIAFPSGTGIAHSFINNTYNDAEFIVSGEMTKKENLCSFPLNPELKNSSKIWWNDPPLHKIGSANPLPLEERKPIQLGELIFKEINFEKNSSIAIKFRADSFYTSFGNDEEFLGEDGKGDTRYLERLKNKNRKEYGAIHVWYKKEIVGQLELGLFQDDCTWGYVNLFYLKESYRGKGFSSYLDIYATNFMKTLGVNRAKLSVSPTNKKAWNYYIRMGWRDCGPRIFGERREKIHNNLIHWMEKKFE